MFCNRFMMFVLLVLALVACQTAEESATPTAAPAPTTSLVETATAVPPSVMYEGIQFEQGGLATAILPALVPEQVIGNDGPLWGTYPAYYQFDFQGYPLEETVHAPRLTIYPAPLYAGLNLAARTQIEAMTTFLADPATGLAQDDLPFIPLFNATQVFHSQAEVVEFNNGRGVRYLTAYSQGIFPLSNEELFYTFQGLTDDGAYYISAIFPISSAILPNTHPNLTTEEWEALSENYSQYVAETTAALDALTADEFLPTLSSLDQLIQSLTVAPPLTAAPANQLAINFPVQHGQYLAGETVPTSGTANTTAGTVTLTLFAGPHQVAEQEAAVDSNGAWSTSLTLPTYIIGPGRLVVQAGSESISHTFSIYEGMADETDTASQPHIVLYRPFIGELLIAGLTNFLSGEVRNPINDTVNIGVLNEDCTAFIAYQSFTATDGEWSGQLILPPDVTGPVCVTAYTGEHGNSEGYEWLVETAIVTARDPSIPRIQIGNPYGSLAKGQSFTLFGSAINVPNNMVELIVAREDGSEIVNTAAVVDTFGYWSAEILLPADTPSFILISASFTDDGQLQQSQAGFNVE